MIDVDWGTDAIDGEALMVVIPIDCGALRSLIRPCKSGVPSMTPILEDKQWKLRRGSGFVNMSASWSFVETWPTLSAPQVT